MSSTEFLKTPTDFAEIIAGSGGLHGLASLIIDSVKRFIICRPPSPENFAPALFTAIVDFIWRLNVRSKELLYSPFIYGGVVGALTSGANAIDHGNTGNTLLRFLHVLRGLLVLGCHRAMREALKAGLLRVIANTIILSPHPDDEYDVFQISGLQDLKRTLPGSTVYRSILTELDIRL
ncbi:hypothetical protein B0H16DRAFT_1769151 [Mycena metata]|uniref:Uncharacterized protein n=1 Tax=Mycena metata TaxID=1033252 RepID=A0AAD7NRX7_9AGAR|nr:hypothetical protein B0H16DRAFT_1769151 [Mycena metata]